MNELELLTYVISKGRHWLEIAVHQTFENGDMICFEESILLAGNIVVVYHFSTAQHGQAKSNNIALRQREILVYRLNNVLLLNKSSANECEALERRT